MGNLLSRRSNKSKPREGTQLIVQQGVGAPDESQLLVELDEGSIIWDTHRSTNRYDSESEAIRLASARAEAERLAEEEARRLAAEQSMRLPYEYEGTSAFPSKSDLPDVSKTASVVSLGAVGTPRESVQERSMTQEKIEPLTYKESNRSFFDADKLQESCIGLFGSCKCGYPHEPFCKSCICTNCGDSAKGHVSCSQFMCEAHDGSQACECPGTMGNIGDRYVQPQCDIDNFVRESTEGCGCMGPKHDKSTCRICRGLHLEDAPLLY